MSIKIARKHIDGELGLVLVALGKAATVADLFIPYQHGADDPLLPKRDHPRRLAPCAGCSNSCCRRYAVMPDILTVRMLQKQVFGTVGAETFKQVVLRYLQLKTDQPFAVFRGNPCPFLAGDLCTIYENRPAYCRFFLCVPSCESLERLKGSVLLLGELALREQLISANLEPAHWRGERWSPAGLPSLNPFVEATSYDEVTLQSCCSEELWLELQSALQLVECSA